MKKAISMMKQYDGQNNMTMEAFVKWYKCTAMFKEQVYYSVLQRIAACCRVLQLVAMCCSVLGSMCRSTMLDRERRRLQHAATHCNTLHHTATHCNTLQHTSSHCNTLLSTTRSGGGGGEGKEMKQAAAL